jgi:hypothetical protein
MNKGATANVIMNHILKMTTYNPSRNSDIENIIQMMQDSIALTIIRFDVEVSRKFFNQFITE